MNYKHDCDACNFLGTFEDLLHKEVTKLDIYWYISPSCRALDSILARYGNKDSEYICCHPPHENGQPRYSWYQFALHRAEKLGLYKKEKQ